MTSSRMYDLIVIGAGAAGSTVADGARGAGWDVALIEEGKVGGTCLNYGCDPTKALIRTAEVEHLASTSGRFGIDVDQAEVDWPGVRNRIDTLIDEIRGGDGPANIRAKGIDLFEGRGTFVAEREIEVNGERLGGDRIVIATGARSDVPAIDGLDGVAFLTNKEAIELDALPSSMVIVGGGFIAVEFAQTFARLGVDIALIASRDTVLPKEDDQLASELTDILEDEGIRIVRNARATAVRRNDGGVMLTASVNDGTDVYVDAEALLIATGRAPNTEGLGLDAAGIRYSDRGVKVNAAMMTSVPDVWAVGDITGIYEFTHVADYQARIVINNMLHPDRLKRADYRVVPWITFTDPELARVGLTEDEARSGGYSVATATIPFESMPRAMTLDEREGMVKLVVDRGTHLILGGHILGASASEMIPQIALLMQANVPVTAIAETIFPYPTMSEAVFWAAKSIVENELTPSSTGS